MNFELTTTGDFRRERVLEEKGKTMTPQAALAQTYASQDDAIAKTMKGYLDGVREGKSELMRLAFHPAAAFFGHYPGGVMNGQLQQLFD